MSWKTGLSTRTRQALATAIAVVSVGYSAQATVITGPGNTGKGVAVGQSSLIGTIDYSDTFTGTADGGKPNRPYVAAVQPAAAYGVENTYGNPANAWSSGGNDQAQFSFAANKSGGALINGTQVYPGDVMPGNSTGVTQTGGGGNDWGIDYIGRGNYIVQMDAVQTPDRVNISTSRFAGTFFQYRSLSVFFRGQPASDTRNGNNVSLFTQVLDSENNPVNLDTPLRGQPGYENFSTGLAGSRSWHNYAVRFDSDNQQIEIYVDERSLAIVDLRTFAGGVYQNFYTSSVGAGYAGGDRLWTDNFQVGSVAPPVVPEPTSLAVLALVGGALVGRRRGRVA